MVIVSAAEFEVRALQKSPHMVQARFVTVGIGPLAAAASAKDLAEEITGEDVIFVGSAGIFGEFDGVALRAITEAHWWPTCERHNLSESIEGLTPKVDFSPSPITEKLPRAAAVSCPNISSSGQLPRYEVRQRGLQDQVILENLEIYSVAAALNAANSVSVILGITNRVGAEGRQQWRANHELCAELTCGYLERELFQLN